MNRRFPEKPSFEVAAKLLTKHGFLPPLETERTEPAAYVKRLTTTESVVIVYSLESDTPDPRKLTVYFVYRGFRYDIVDEALNCWDLTTARRQFMYSFENSRQDFQILPSVLDDSAPDREEKPYYGHPESPSHREKGDFREFVKARYIYIDSILLTNAHQHVTNSGKRKANTLHDSDGTNSIMRNKDPGTDVTQEKATTKDHDGHVEFYHYMSWRGKQSYEHLVNMESGDYYCYAATNNHNLHMIYSYDGTTGQGKEISPQVINRSRLSMTYITHSDMMSNPGNSKQVPQRLKNLIKEYQESLDVPRRPEGEMPQSLPERLCKNIISRLDPQLPDVDTGPMTEASGMSKSQTVAARATNDPFTFLINDAQLRKLRNFSSWTSLEKDWLRLKYVVYLNRLRLDGREKKHIELLRQAEENFPTLGRSLPVNLLKGFRERLGANGIKPYKDELERVVRQIQLRYWTIYLKGLSLLVCAIIVATEEKPKVLQTLQTLLVPKASTSVKCDMECLDILGIRFEYSGSERDHLLQVLSEDLRHIVKDIREEKDVRPKLEDIKEILKTKKKLDDILPFAKKLELPIYTLAATRDGLQR